MSLIIMDVFWSKLDELLEGCNLQQDEKRFLEDVAGYLVDKDPQNNPRTLASRSFRKLKETGNLYADYRNLIKEYQKKKVKE